MKVTVAPGAAGERLDQFLTARIEGRSRSEVQRWLKEGRVQVSGVNAPKASLRLEVGMDVLVDIPETPTQAPDLAPEPIALRILYEDADILVIDKPAGMVVHPAPGHAAGTLVNALLAHDAAIGSVGGELRPGIVHRLDRDTSGLIVVARNDRAHRNLQAQFKARTVYKEYICLVEGGVEPPAGIIDAPVGRHAVDRKRQAVWPAAQEGGASPGRRAITEYHTLARFTAPAALVRGAERGMTFTLLRVVLHTGRTHQIRVHLAWRKHPVASDTLYGPRTPRLPLGRQFLHAHRLRFVIPSLGEAREFVSPLPEDLQRLLDRLTAE